MVFCEALCPDQSEDTLPYHRGRQTAVGKASRTSPRRVRTYIYPASELPGRPKAAAIERHHRRSPVMLQTEKSNPRCNAVGKDWVLTRDAKFP